MTFQHQIASAKNYSTAGTILLVLTSVVLMVMGSQNFNRDFFAMIGIILIIVALFVYMTTSDRLRRGTHQEAMSVTGSMILWAVVSIVLAAILAGIYLTIYTPTPGIIQLLAWCSFIFAILAGIFFAFAYTSLPGPEVAMGRGVEPLRSPTGIGGEAATVIEGAIPTGTGSALATLRVGSGRQANQAFQITRTSTVIGRGNGNPVDIKLDDSNISRQHARIDYDGKDFSITDLNSTNGTYVDGTIAPANKRLKLSPGAQIRLGKDIYVSFETPSPSGPTQVETAG